MSVLVTSMKWPWPVLVLWVNWKKFQLFEKQVFISIVFIGNDLIFDFIRMLFNCMKREKFIYISVLIMLSHWTSLNILWIISLLKRYISTCISLIHMLYFASFRSSAHSMDFLNIIKAPMKYSYLWSLIWMSSKYFYKRNRSVVEVTFQNWKYLDAAWKK